ncbi:LuxR family transcriptional regulator [Thiospirochaeta perfilievii]|uniref:LuxR family transcriptional regulator n=1 Tax=Thiospirochaeta perfilievii TaxID=252967 RepID=A0A5C1Q7Y2_9SPIO|nr:helix-turn-helix transcriptional regulator [Thiospirochaeta perfilievii]QEN03571.1 LuxR family transcriptional regulator [Thiospirochaeta perfilievii]
MDKNLSKRFGLYIGIIVFIIFLTDIIVIYNDKGTLKNHYYYFTLLFISLIMVISSRFKIGKYIQVFSLISTTIVSFFLDQSSGYGIGQVIIIVLLSQKYGFFKKNMLIKVILSVLTFISIVVITVLFKKEILFNILPPILFLIVFGASFIIIKYEEIQVYLKKEQLLKEEIFKLKHKIKEINEFVDPVESGLSQTELLVLESLCKYKETNQDLATRLVKSEHTIKSHIKNILNKIGAENRYQLIDLCKGYFTTE